MSSDDTHSSSAFPIFAGLSAILAIALAILLFLFYSSGTDEILDAISTGQRITIHTSTGVIDGNMHRSDSASTAAELPPSLDTSVENETSSHDDGSEMEEPEPSFDVGYDTGFDVGEDTFSEDVDIASPQKDALIASEEEVYESIRVYPRSAASLAEAPSPSLIERSTVGDLPKRGGGSNPWQYYSRPFTKTDKFIIAMLVVDLGLNQRLSESAFALPPEVSFSFSPYGVETSTLVKNARNLGHEAWLHLPVQPKDYPASDPGPFGLIAELDARENTTRLYHSLASFAGYSGVSLPVGEGFSASTSGLKLVLEQLKERGLALIFSHRTTNVETLKLLNNYDSIAITGDLIIDADPNPESISNMLNTLEKIARAKGSALGIAHGYPITIHTLKKWAANLPTDVELAPVSALIGMKQ